jgi:tetratricopeptide (TPR) repeat protein
MGLFGRKGKDSPEPIDELRAAVAKSRELGERAVSASKNGDLRAALDFQVEQVAQLRAIAAARPTIQNHRLLGVMLSRLTIYRNQARPADREEIIAELREAIRLLKPSSDMPTALVTVYARNQVLLARLLDTPDSREERVEAGLEAARWLRDLAPGNEVLDKSLADTLHLVANALTRLGRDDEVLTVWLEYISVLDRIGRRVSDRGTAGLAVGLAALAVLHAKAGDHSGGTAAAERCRLLLAEPEIALSAAERAGIALNFHRFGYNVDPMHWLNAALELQRELDAEQPGNYRMDFVRILNSLAWRSGQLGDIERGLRLIGEAIELLDPMQLEESADLVRQHAAVLDTAAELHFLAERCSEALPLSERSVELGRALLAMHPASDADRENLDHCERRLARIEVRLADSQAA